MTRRQAETLAFIKAYIAEHEGVSPSFAEIAKAIGLASRSGVHRLVWSLVGIGELVRHPTKWRSFALPMPKACPHCGGAIQ